MAVYGLKPNDTGRAIDLVGCTASPKNPFKGVGVEHSLFWSIPNLHKSIPKKDVKQTAIIGQYSLCDVIGYQHSYYQRIVMQQDHSLVVIVVDWYNSRWPWLWLFPRPSNAKNVFVSGLAGIGFSSREGWTASNESSWDGADFPKRSIILVLTLARGSVVFSRGYFPSRAFIPPEPSLSVQSLFAWLL